MALAEWADFLHRLRGRPFDTSSRERRCARGAGVQRLLVNISRGTVVDEQVLVAALVERRLARAALEVNIGIALRSQCWGAVIPSS